MPYKENWLYKTSYNSYTVEDKKRNSACERMLFDSTYLVSGRIDCSSYVILKNQS